MTTIKKHSKLLLVTTVIFAIVVAFLCTGITIAASRPTVRISNIGNCSQGDSVSFFVDFSGNNIINGGNIPFSSSYVVVHGFSANVSVVNNGIINGNTRRYRVTLNNVRGEGSGKYVEVRAGAAIANDGISTASSSTTYSNSFNIQSVDNVAPSISLIGPNISSVNNGGTVTYIVRYTDASGVTNVNLYKNSIKLNGFTANVSITGSGENSKVVERKITLSNIQGTNGSKYISIVAATASDYSGHRTNGANSGAFKLVNRAASSNGANSSSPSTGDGQNQEGNQEETSNEENKDKPSDWVPNPNTGKY